MLNPNNPLKQYFRRPAIYLKLPSGGLVYSPDVIDLPDNGELPIYPMTAIDEITTRTPDALFNGDAMVELIKSCIPNIKNPYEINSTDFDAILIGIKTATQGNEYEINSECPKCTEVATYNVNLVSLLSNIQTPDYDTPFEFNDLKFKFRPLTYKEMNEINLNQFEIQKHFAQIETESNEMVKIEKSKDALKLITDLTIKVLSKTIESIETPESLVSEPQYILEYLNNCDKKTFATIRDKNADLKLSSSIKPLKVVCPSCNNNYEQSIIINATDFFG